ncbi:SMI1/KNR4 family protein [Sphingomonas sp. NCPPB 2930]
MIDVAAIEVFEGFVGVGLPSVYRNYLLSENGGRPEKSRFDIPGQGDDVVNRFFSVVAKNKSETLTYALSIYKDRIPAEMLPIGNDPGGNLILLALKGGKRGEVFFWDHEKEADDEPQPFYENIISIAKNFSSFLDALY